MLCKNNKVGSLVTVTITDGTTYSYIYSTPETMPTSKPASPQLSFTVSESNVPTFSTQIKSCEYLEAAIIWGYNTSGASQTISFEAVLNGVSKYTGTFTGTNNNYWTLLAMFEISSDVVGDVLEFYVWDASGLTTLYGKGAYVTVTHPQYEQNKQLYNVSLENATTTLLQNVPNATASGENYYLFDSVRLQNYYQAVNVSKEVAYSDPYTWSQYYIDPAGGAGEYNKVYGRVSSSGRPFYRCPRFPHKTTYRVMREDGEI